jgi:hypothetical protein
MMNDSQIAKYEAWIQKLEHLHADVVCKRPVYYRIFVAIPIVSLLGFFWGVWFGVATLLTGIMMCGFGFYSVFMIEGDFDREIEGLRRSVANFRATDRSNDQNTGDA